MQLSSAIRFGGWLFLLLILLLGLGTIAIFTRMSPAIETILKQNEKSLQASEEMLVAVIRLQNESPDQQSDVNADSKGSFRMAYETAAGNVTEPGEQELLNRISSHGEKAMSGDQNSVYDLVAAIQELSQINRKAMHLADDRARRLGNAGAWGVVFMALSVFTIGLVYLRTVSNQLIAPLNEIYEVVVKSKDEPFRRCSRQNDSSDIRLLYERINKLLDQ